MRCIVSVTEQPHKLPYYSALLMVLTHNQYLLDEPFNKNGPVINEDATKEDGKDTSADVKPDVDVKMESVDGAADVKMEVKEEVGVDELNRRISWLVIQDMNERFGKWVAERQWLKVRLCVSTIGVQALVEVLTLSSATILCATRQSRPGRALVTNLHPPNIHHRPLGRKHLRPPCRTIYPRHHGRAPARWTGVL